MYRKPRSFLQQGACSKINFHNSQCRYINIFNVSYPRNKSHRHETFIARTQLVAFEKPSQNTHHHNFRALPRVKAFSRRSRIGPFIIPMKKTFGTLPSARGDDERIQKPDTLRRPRCKARIDFPRGRSCLPAQQ